LIDMARLEAAALVPIAAAACAFEIATEPEPAVVERELVASDGSREFPFGWWDTRHRIPCSFSRIADGVFRCEPRSLTSYELSLDPGCGETFPAVLEDRPGFFRLRDAGGLYAIDRRFEADAAYRRFPLAGCLPFATAGWSVVEVVADPPLHEVSEPSSSAFEASAGVRLRIGNEPSRWFDPELDTACGFARIGGALRCYPAELERRESINLFSNPGCDNRDAELVLGESDARFVLTSPVQRVLEVSAEIYDGPLYELTFSGCVETASVDARLGTPVTERFVRGLALPGR
jgi:hypothetical protein